MKKTVLALLVLAFQFTPNIAGAQTPTTPTLWVATSYHADATFVSHQGTWTVEEGDFRVQYMLINCDTLYVNFQLSGTNLSASNSQWVGFSLPPGLEAADSMLSTFAYSTNGTAGTGVAATFPDELHPHNIVYLHRDWNAALAFNAGTLHAGGQFFVKVKHTAAQ
jgi:hypothetical protein